MWFSAAFALLAAGLLIAVTADHLQLLRLPRALQPYCGAQACEYNDTAMILLLMIVVGAASHIIMRLMRRFFLP
jgi:hypothetical protein